MKKLTFSDFFFPPQVSSFPILTQFELQAPLFGLSPVHPFYRLLFSLVPRSRSSEMLILLVKRFYVNENGCVIRGDNGRTWNSGKESLKKKNPPSFNGKGNGKNILKWIHFASLVRGDGFFPVDNIVIYVCVLWKLHRGKNMFRILCIYLFIALHQWVWMSTHACPCRSVHDLCL